MMSDNAFYLAIGVADAAPAGIEELKNQAHQRDVNLFEKDQRLFLYPINDGLSDAFDESGIDLDPEKVRLSLNWINPETQIVVDSELTKKIQQVDFFNSTFQLFDLPTVISFVDNNSDAFENEKASLSGSDGSTDNESSFDQQQYDEPDNSNDDESEDPSIDNIPEEFTDVNKSEATKDSIDTQPTLPEKYDSSGNVINSEQEEQVSSKNEAFNKTELSAMFDPTESEEYDESEYVSDDDPLLQAAIRIFDSKTIGDELPSFDEKTANLVNSEIVDANNHVDNARQQAIASIYYELKDNNDREIAEAEKKEIAEAKIAHEKNIERLKQNNQTRLKELEKKEKASYDTKKRKAGEVALKDFYAQYDAEHLDEVNNIIEHKSQPIKQELQDDIEEENQNFDEYREKVKQAVFNHVTEKYDVNNIVNGYRKVVGNESRKLIDKVKAIENENTRLKKEIENYKRSKQISDETYDARLQAEIAKGVNEGSHSYRKQVEEADDRRRQAEDENQRLRQKNDEYQEKLDSVLDRFSNITDKYSQIQLASQPMQFNPNQQYTSQSQQPTIPQHRTSKTDVKGWRKYIGIAGAALVMMSLSSAITAFIINSHQQPVQQTAAVEQSHNTESSAATSNTATEQSDKSPDTFTYTTKDGKKYAVIKDDDHSGHYIDDKGVTHTVLINEK